MTLVDEGRKIANSLGALGARRLWLLGLVGLLVVVAIGGAAYYLSRPQFEVLYSGLDTQDASRVTSVLRDANVNFDVSADGGTVLVEYGGASRARMLLAEHGLPRNASAGYELFDKIGSLGLTSFMQDVTRVRALEGELARSIQSMQGVMAARVHIVLADEGTFRKSKQTASASVIVRLSSAADASVAQAIRHLVAAATPGMTIDAVTVLNTDGSVLASGSDSESSAPTKELGLEKNISTVLQENIRRTLTPMLGVRNLNVSVATQLNIDKKQINETVYNPESRVERSIRVVKENQTTENANTQGPTTVERNIPNDKTKSDGKQTVEDSQKKEELTNYEISSKSIATTSAGYAVERLSVAILVNRAAVAAKLGDKPDQATIDKRLAEITDLAASAVGFNKERGDQIKVVAVDFADESADLEPVAGPGFLQLAMRQSGRVVNALALVAAVGLLAFFGLRPLANSMAAIGSTMEASALEANMAEQPFPMAIAAAPSSMEPMSLGLEESPRRASQRRLEQFVAQDEEHAAAVIKDWVRNGDQL